MALHDEPLVSIAFSATLVRGERKDPVHIMLYECSPHENGLTICELVQDTFSADPPTIFIALLLTSSMVLTYKQKDSKIEFSSIAGHGDFEIIFTCELEYWSFQEAYGEAMVKLSSRKVELSSIMSKALKYVPKVAKKTEESN